MIGLEIKGAFLDLPEGLEISLRLISPLFSAEIGDNSHSLSFRLPGSNKNRDLLGHYDSAMIRNAPMAYSCRLWAEGLPWIEGQLLVINGAGGFDCRFETDLSIIISTLKQTKLEALDLGGLRNIATGGALNKQLSIEETTTLGMARLEVNGFVYSQIWQPQFGEFEMLVKFEQLINNDTGANNVSATVQNINGNDLLVLQPAPGFNVLSVDINPPGNQQTWTLENEAGLATVIHAAILSHMKTVALDGPGAHDYVFAPIEAPDWYGGQVLDWLGYVNAWDWSAQEFVNNSDGNLEKWRNSAVPFVRAGYILEQILALIGYTDISSFTALADWQAIYFWNNVSLDQIGEIGPLEFNRFRSEMDLKNHVPKDWTAADFLVWMRDCFNLGILVNHEKKEILFYQKALLPSANRADWSGLCLAGARVKRKKESERGYTLTYQADETDGFNDDDFQQIQHPDYVFDRGASRIEVKIAPIYERVSTHFNQDGSWRMGAIKQTGRTAWPDLEPGEYSPRAFFYRGLREGSTGKLYPMATPADTDFNGLQIGAFSLSWSPASAGFALRGLWEYFFAAWWEGRAEEAEADQGLALSALEIKALAYQYPFTLRSPEGSYLGAIKQLNISLAQAGIRSARALFFRL